MAIFLLDSTVIIDLLNDRKHRDVLLAELIRPGNVVACCAINVAEVYSGLKPGQERRTEELLRSLEFLQITWEIARDGGLLRLEYLRKGRTLSLADCIIAAVALRYNATLITDNTKHFPMPNLRLYPPGETD